MKKSIFLLLMVLFFLQFSFLPMIFPNFHLNLLLALVVSLAIHYSFAENIVWIGLAGLLLDFFSFNNFGVGWLAFLGLGYLASLIKEKLLSDKRSLVSGFLIFLFMKLFFDFLQFILIWPLRYYRILPPEKSVFIFWQQPGYGQQVLVFIAVGLIILKIIDILNRTLGKERLELRVKVR